MNRDFSVAVIISTYNNPQWLHKSLWAYTIQTVPPDEVIIADDGSGPDTQSVINSFCKYLPIKHIWHEDNGFQKSVILNKAIVAAESDYLIFTDQDCVPKADFVEVHVRNARAGHFLSGGNFKLNKALSLSLSLDDISAQLPFSPSWLWKNGQHSILKYPKIALNGFLSRLLNTFSTARRTWNGCNASGWKNDILAVNGHNEDMHYGGQDREMGERLINMGVTPICVRYSAALVHLDHERSYKTQESINYNLGVRKYTREHKVVQTPHGIKKL